MKRRTLLLGTSALAIARAEAGGTGQPVPSQGSTQQRRCPNKDCRQVVMPTWRFCAACGASLPPLKPAPSVPPTSVRLELTGLPAGAKVTVDEKLLSGTVFTDEVASPTKEVEVLVQAPGFRPFVRTVVLKRGEAARLEVSLEAKPASPVVPAVRPALSSRLRDYPQLRAYLEALRPIPAGTFQMGSQTGDPDENPVHQVALSDFRMGATPVTVAMWKEYCKASINGMPEGPAWGWIDGHPMVNVSWVEITGGGGSGGYCAWASAVSGLKLELPSEAQWEYAARGGGLNIEYPWGNHFDNTKLWCSVGSEKRSKTAPVRRSFCIHRNKFGLTDMTGNVYQWCKDHYGPYGETSQLDPVGPPLGDSRVLRGGAWYYEYNSRSFRISARFRRIPVLRVDFIGFRLVALDSIY